MSTKLFEKTFKIIDILFILMKLNVFWIFFTLLGIGIFGFFPATISLFSCLRDYLRNGEQGSLFKLFKKNYVENFATGNRVGLLFLFAFLFIFFQKQCLEIFQDKSGAFLFEIVIKVLRLLFLTVLINFFPVFVHFDLKREKIILQPLLLTFICPLQTILSIIIVLGTYYLYFNFSLLGLFLGLALPAYGITAIDLTKFEKLINTYVKTNG